MIEAMSGQMQFCPDKETKRLENGQLLDVISTFKHCINYTNCTLSIFVTIETVNFLAHQIMARFDIHFSLYSLSEFYSLVKDIEDTLTDVLDYEDDMADMYLSHCALTGYV